MKSAALKPRTTARAPQDPTRFGGLPMEAASVSSTETRSGRYRRIETMKQTLAMNSVRSSRLTPKSALALLIAAAAAWFAVYQWMGLWDPAHDHVEAGRFYVRVGSPQQAAQEWRAAVRVNPNSVEAWELLGE